MTTYYKDFKIDVFNDDLYTFASVDNTITYKNIYRSDNDDDCFINQHGIKIYLQENEVSSAILCANGGSTTIHPTSYLIKDDSLYICCGQQIYSLNVPSLTLNWNKETDLATCFEIYEFENDLIIHGELEITRLTNNGDIKWQFSARDIFVNINGEKAFEIINHTVKLIDWDDNKYLLDGDGKVIE